MASHASTLLLLAVVVGLASLASYLLSQWRARRGNEPLALAGIGIGTALLLASVFITVLGVLLFSQKWLSRLNEIPSQSDAAAGDSFALPNPFDSVEIEPPPDLGIQSNARQDSRRNRAREESAQNRQVPEVSARADAGQSELILPSVGRKHNPSALSASDPWAATQCVVPFKREWDDGTRWTIVNDCGVAVAIVIATCEWAAIECSNGTWRYPADGLLLPAKIQRPTTQAEETQYVNELRHAACAVTDPTAVNLIGMDSEARTEQWQSEFAVARVRDTCLSEVRGLTALGRRSGVPIDALFGHAVYSRVAQ
jgi:hypothetical protein